MRRLPSLVVVSAVVALTAACGHPDATSAAATGKRPTSAIAPAPSVAATTGPPPAQPPPAAPGPPPAAPKNPAADASTVQQLLAQVNQLRAQHGLPPYRLSAGLVASAHAHNLRMAPPNGCGLSHRCPGEADLGPRIKAQGVNWHTAGENCGVGGAANTQAAILAAAKGLTMSMYNEKPPGDGHRRNILGAGYTMIGIDVIRDAKGRVWLTQDFAG